jgi:peptide/nickel transport system substrate-binding protein
MKRHCVWLLSLVVLASLVVGQWGAAIAPAKAQTPEPAAGEPVKGGVLKVAMQALPPTLDSGTTVTTTASQVMLHVVETLVAFGEDYSVVPMLAESWDISQDGMTYTFHLRKGVKFHNGKEMTSEDVIASMDRYMQVTPRKSSFQMLKSYEATDANTVVMHLNAPSAAFLSALAYASADLSIYPKEIITGKAANALKPEDIIGTGPYKLAEYVPDQMVRLTRFDDYSALPGKRNGLGGNKTSYVDELQFIYVPEAGARVAGLMVGDYDFIIDPPSSEIDNLSNNPDTGVQVFKPGWGAYILFNFLEPLSANLKFRQAVQTVLDMDAIGMAGTNGRKDLYQLDENVWPPQTTWYWDDPEAKALYNQKNVEKAKQLLAESGYNGEEVILMTNRDYDQMYKTMMSVSDQLKTKLGMNVKVELYDWPANLQKWSEKGWHISVTLNVSLQLINPNAALADWGLGNANIPELTAAFQNLDKATTMDQRKELLKPALKIFLEQVVNVKAVDFFLLDAGRRDLTGYTGWYRPRFFGVWRAPKA